ncbi:hypothetical protein L195_g038248 [Trifolium pratense]|uniref:Uncharacterized protein n=1 Tax=Trifolium pratense TaxID=57577 RepID=A0A2K3LUN8_TRIPR|nr:hypothetical protein L195_g038248 [Trifolium pratense]
MDNMACNKVQHVRKAKKKLDRLKQAEKKRRRLEKALANSAAIISELEKKKQKKKEEQQRLDEEGAATAEAVALHVLLGEDEDDSYNKVDRKTWDDYNHNREFFMGGKRACLPNLYGCTWSVTAENGKWFMSFRPFENNIHEPIYKEAGWDPTRLSIDLIAAQAIRSLQIAENADEDRILF